MDSVEIPDAYRLSTDMARAQALLRRPLDSFLCEEFITYLDTSKNRSSLAMVMRRHFKNLDGRIRFVEAGPDGNPKGTMKLFAVDKAISTAAGCRLLHLLDGGVVAATVMKDGAAKDWCIVELKTFLPVGKERARHEDDLESLLQIYQRNPDGKSFPATDIGAFQIRTGPGVYDVYLKAQEYFGRQF